MMKQKIFLAIGVAFVSVVSGQLAYAGPAEAIHNAQRDGVLHGAVLIASADEVYLDSYCGVLSESSGVLVDDDTRFRIASLTKLVTQLAVMRLVDEGKVELDAPISLYRPRLRAEWKDTVTIRHLLSMTSGLPREIYSDPLKGVTLSRKGMGGSFLDRNAGLELEFDPGSGSSYSNVGYWLLGAVIESVTGQPIVEAFDTLVCEPLGCDGVVVSPKKLGDGHDASGHQRQGGETVQVDDYPVHARYSSGSLSATGKQMVAIARGVFDEEYLSEESRSLMMTEFGTDGDDGQMMIAGMLPGFMNLIMIDRDRELIVVSLNNRVAENPNEFMGVVRGSFEHGWDD